MKCSLLSSKKYFMNTNLLDKLKSDLITISQYNENDIYRTNDLGTEFNFLVLSDSVKLLKKVVDRFLNSDLDFLSSKKVENIQNILFELFDHLLLIKEFKASMPSGVNPNSRRVQLIENLNNIITRFIEFVVPYLGISIDQNEYLKNIESNIKVKVNEINILTEESKKLLDAQRSAVSSSGIEKYSDLFFKEYSIYSNWAKYWLIAACVILAILVCFGIYLLAFSKIPTNTNEFVFLSIGRVIIIISLFYALNVCNKNIKANRHNAILNKHRHSALLTFQTFTESIENDVATKNAILMEATRTIFGIQATGFNDNDSESENPIKIIEVLKGIGSGKP